MNFADCICGGSFPFSSFTKDTILENLEIIDLELEGEHTWKDKAEVVGGYFDRIVRGPGRPNLPTIPSWSEQPKFLSRRFAENWLKQRKENLDQTLHNLYWSWHGNASPRSRWHFNAQLPPEWEYAPELFPPTVKNPVTFQVEYEEGEDEFREGYLTSFILATPARTPDDHPLRLSTPVSCTKLWDRLAEVYTETHADEIEAVTKFIEGELAELKRKREEETINEICEDYRKRQRIE